MSLCISSSSITHGDLFFVTSASLSFKSWCTIPIKSHQLPLNPINSHCLILRGSIPYWGMAEEVKNIPVETVEMPHPQDHDAPIWLMIFTALWFLEHIFRHLDSWWLMYTMVYRCVQLQTRCLQLPGQPGLDGRCVMLSLVIFAILQLFLSTSERGAWKTEPSWEMTTYRRTIDISKVNVECIYIYSYLLYI